MHERRRFAIRDCLGRGGFGEVYLAQMRQPGGLETRVAVKVLREDLQPGSDAVRRLRDEGRLLARLAHPTILRVLDLTLLDGRVALVTEYVDGADLSDCWAASDPLGVRASLQVIGRVAAALSVVHQATDLEGRPLGLVHRDIKPTNIRLGRHGQVKLLDFGIAWSRADDREARTDSDLVVGSLHYMAPERFLSKRADPAWDVFGLGAVLYEGLARRRFLPEGLREAARLATRQPRYEPHLAEALDFLGERVPGPVVDLVGELLAFAPEDRPEAGTIEARCEALADEVGGPSLVKWCRAHDWTVERDVEGPLEGRTLTEGTLGLSVGDDDVTTEGSPRTVRGPVPTVETPGSGTPRLEDEPATVPPASPDTTSPGEDTTTTERAVGAPEVETRWVHNPPRPSEAPTEEVSRPMDLTTEEVPPSSAPAPRRRMSGTGWAFFAGGVLLAFAAVLAAVGTFAVWIWLQSG